MRIALIDDGLDPQDACGYELAENLTVRPSGLIVRRCGGSPERSGHGRRCADIIACETEDVSFCSLQIFRNSNLSASVRQLVSALNYCCEKEIPIIHLSLGTRVLGDRAVLYPILSKMVQKRQVMVAASHNLDGWSLPACFPGVFSVEADNRLAPGILGYRENLLALPVFCASSHQRGNPAFNSGAMGSSYAAPYLTAIIHEILKNEAPLSQNIADLRCRILSEKIGRKIKSKKACSDMSAYPFPEFIHSAVLINLAKQAVCPSELSFPVLAEFAEGDEELICKFLQSRQEKTDVVMLPRNLNHEPDLKWRKWLWQHRELYENLAILAPLPRHSPLWQSGKLIWHVPHSARKAKKLCSDEKLFVLMLRESGESGLRFLRNLKHYLLKEGFQILAYSSHPLAPLYQIDCLPPIMCPSEWRHFFNFAVKAQFADGIILQCSDASESLNEVAEFIIELREGTAVTVHFQSRPISRNQVALVSLGKDYGAYEMEALLRLIVDEEASSFARD